MLRALLVVALLALGAGWPLAVFAAPAPPAVRFVYDRAPSAGDCPDREAVLDAVRARLGFDPFHEPPEIVIRASVARAGDELRATILLSDDAKAGERRLVSRRADCGELASAMELALSIAVDPLSVTREPPPPPPPRAESAPLPPPARPVAAVSAAASPPPPRPPAPWPHVLASVGAAGNVGVSLAPALGLLAGAGLRGGSWSLQLEGRADLPRSRQVEGGRISASTLAATVAPCLHRGPVGGCLLATVAALRGSGQDLADAHQVTTTLVALGARALVEVPLAAAVALRAHADLASPLVRTTLRVGGNPVWSAPPLSFALGVSAVVTLW